MSTNITVNGTHLVVWEKLQANYADARGMSRFVIPVEASSLADAQSITPQAVIDAVKLTNCRCTGIKHGGFWANNLPIVNFEFEGITGPTDYTAQLARATFELDITSEQIPLDSHPLFKEVIETRYGWDGVNRRIKDTGPIYPNGNPLNIRRATHFKSLNATFRLTVVCARAPSRILLDMDSSPIVAKPEGWDSLGITNPNRNWRYDGARVSNHTADGPVTVVKNYQMSGPNGFNGYVYLFRKSEVRSALEAPFITGI